MTPFEMARLAMVLKGELIRFGSVEITLASGRKFRYQLQDYPFRVEVSEAELDDLVCRIIKDKYRYCEWDRNHPRTNTEIEIFDAIKKMMIRTVAKAREYRAEQKIAKNK